MLCILYEIVLTFGVYLYYFVFNYVRRLEISLYQALLKMWCIIIIIIIIMILLMLLQHG